MSRLRTPVGAKDSLPADCSEKAALKGRLMPLFESFGFEALSSPLVEYASVFEAAGAGAGDYRAFIDNDGSTLALKPDMTPSIARIAASVYGGEESAPLRYSYFERLYRPTARFQGKLKEFTQAGVELIGESGAYADAQVCALAAMALSKCGLKDFCVYISEAGLFGALLKAAGFNENQALPLKERVLARDFVAFESAVGGSNADKALKELLIDLPFLKGGADVLSRAGVFADVSRLAELYEVLGRYGVTDNIRFDLSLAGAWDYYTGVIFRGYGAGVGAAIISGGRYDDLSARFGAKFPAVGFGLQIEPLQEALAAQNTVITEKPVKTFVAFKGGFDYNEGRVAEAAIRAAAALRAGGDIVITAPPIGDEQTAIERAKALGCAGLLYFAGASAAIMNLETGELDIKAIADLDLEDYGMGDFE